MQEKYGKERVEEVKSNRLQIKVKQKLVKREYRQNQAVALKGKTKEGHMHKCCIKPSLVWFEFDYIMLIVRRVVVFAIAILLYKVKTKNERASAKIKHFVCNQLHD